MTQAAEQAIGSVTTEIASNFYHKTLTTNLPVCLADEDTVFKRIMKYSDNCHMGENIILFVE